MPEKVLGFKPEDHTYWLGSTRLPSQSEILEVCGVVDKTYYTPESAHRGTIVHAGCHYLAEGDLDWASMPEQFRGYLHAYEKFLVDTKFKPTECEKRLYHPELLYGVTPDQIGLLEKREGVAELKSGTMMPWTAIQTAFQTMARWPNDYMTKFRLGVELHKDGTYTTKWFEDYGDFQVAIGLLALYRWKMNHTQRRVA